MFKIIEIKYIEIKNLHILQADSSEVRNCSQSTVIVAILLAIILINWIINIDCLAHTHTHLDTGGKERKWMYKM